MWVGRHVDIFDMFSDLMSRVFLKLFLNIHTRLYIPRTHTIVPFLEAVSARVRAAI